MKREAGVMQQRIEALSIRRRRLQALEWVGGKEKEGIEAKADHRLRAQGRHMGIAAQAPLEQGNRPTRKAHDGNPQQHGTFMITPCPGNLVKHRLHRMAVHRHQLHRSEEHTSELQSLMRISYAVFCLKKKKKLIYRHSC